MPETAAVGPVALIDSIGDLITGAVDQVTEKVDNVRSWAGSEGPCARQQYLHEHSLTVRPTVREAAGLIAWLDVAGPNAIQASILAKGRASTQVPKQYTGGLRLAAYMADNVLPDPPGVVLANLLGGPIGAGAARGAWLDWIDDHLPVGRPSGATGGSPFLGRTDIRIRNGVLRGSAVRAGWDAWRQYQIANVQPYGRHDWAAKLASAKAKYAGLEAKELDLLAEISRYEVLCNEQRQRENERIDRGLAGTAAERKAKLALIALGILAATYAITES